MSGNARSRVAIPSIVMTLAALAGAAPAGAAPGDAATFALVVGVNAAPDPDTRPLRYADDDAARFQDLFRALGARTVVLSRLDDDTRRLHPQAAAEAREPRVAELERAVSELAGAIVTARARGVRTVLYFVYAGHGNVRDGEGYLTLEDGRLSSENIVASIVDRIGADRSHLVVDACHSAFLATPRGPGGERRPLHGFANLDSLARRARVGLLLSSTPTGEAHEWEAFQAGVFSHEVRSGLYGAADADGDGVVSYREIAAFVHQANAAIPNERFRPVVYARPPAAGDTFVDLRATSGAAVIIDGAHHAHWLLEDEQGVRLAEWHNGAGQEVRLVRPPSSGRLFVRRMDDGLEAELPRQEEPVAVAALTLRDPLVRVRGAAQVAFTQVFSLPFDGTVVAQADLAATGLGQAERRDGVEQALRGHRRRVIIGAGSLAVAVMANAAAAVCLVSASNIRSDVSQRTTGQQVTAANESIHRRNIAAGVLFGIGGAAALTGLTLILWPDRHGGPAVQPVSGGGLSAGWIFGF